MSQSQRDQALGRANRIRFARSDLKNELKLMSRQGGVGRVADLIDYPLPDIRTMRVMELVLACRRIGPTLGRRWFNRAGVRSDRRFGDLTDRERGALVGELREYAHRVDPSDRFFTLIPGGER